MGVMVSRKANRAAMLLPHSNELAALLAHLGSRRVLSTRPAALLAVSAKAARHRQVATQHLPQSPASSRTPSRIRYRVKVSPMQEDNMVDIQVVMEVIHTALVDTIRPTGTI